MEPSPVRYWNPVRILFALWGLIVIGGFLFTYYDQNATIVQIDGVWVVLALIGLIYMKWLLPWRESSGRAIFLTWLVLIALGIALTHISFAIPALLMTVAPRIGVLWLIIMGLGHAITGAIDRKKIYILTALLQFAAAYGTWTVLASNPALFQDQYLVAGVVGAISMLLLVVYA
jgi:hypothetical protein